MSASTASSRPSAAKAPRTMCRWSRLWNEAVRFSRRSSIHASEPPNLARRPDQEDVFRDQRHLLAEAAADIGGDDAELALRHAEAVGDAGAEHVRHLGRAGQRHPAGAPVEGGEAGARLERHGILPARRDVDLDHRRRVGERLGEALGLDLAFDQDVAGGVGMDQRRAGRECRLEIDDAVLRARCRRRPARRCPRPPRASPRSPPRPAGRRR